MKALSHILITGLALISISCTGNFDDLNTDPNSATTVTASLLATPLLLDITATGGTGSGFISDNCLAKQMIWLESLHDYNYNLLGRAGVGDYKTLINTLKMVELAEEKDKAAYEGLALFIKSYKIYNGVQIAICIVSVLIIYFLAHVDNANNELTKSERKYLRNKVRIFLSSEVVIFVLLLIKANEYWSGIIAISMMIVAILVLAGFIENRIRG